MRIFAMLASSLMLSITLFPVNILGIRLPGPSKGRERDDGVTRFLTLKPSSHGLRRIWTVLYLFPSQDDHQMLAACHAIVLLSDSERDPIRESGVCSVVDGKSSCQVVSGYLLPPATCRRP